MPQFESVEISLAQIVGHGCAWKGCVRKYRLPKRPYGWVSVLVWKANEVAWPTIDTPMERDCELCPQHAAQLDALLKRIR